MSRGLWAELAAATRTKAGPSRRLWSLLGLAVTVAMLVLVWRTVDLGRLMAALRGMSLPAAALGVTLLAAAYAAKSVRWRTMLGELGSDAGLGLAAATFLGGIALNNLLPLRAGDIARAVVLNRPLGLPVTALAGALVLERLLDLLALLAMLAAVMLALPADLVPSSLTGTAAAIAAAAAAAGLALVAVAGPAARLLASLIARTGPTRLAAALDLVRRMLLAVEGLARGPLLVRLVALTALAWALEAGLYIAAAQALHLARPSPSGALAFALGTLSTLMPSSPGYFGTFHYFAMQAVAALGAPSDQAAAYAIVTHALLWLPTTLAGVLGLGVVSLRRGAEDATESA